MKSITTMIKQLKRKFPGYEMSISHDYSYYTNMDSIKDSYTLNIFMLKGNSNNVEICALNLSYQGLIDAVNKTLKEVKII